MSSNELATSPPPEAVCSRGAAAELVDPAPSRAMPVLRTAGLLTWDALAPTLLLGASVWLTGATTPSGAGFGPIPAIALLMGLGSLTVLALVGAYRAEARPSLALAQRLVLAAGILALVAAYAGARLGWSLHPDALAIAFCGLPIAWLAGRAALLRPRRVQRVLVLGSGRVARQLTELSRRHPDAGLEVIGCLDDDPLDRGEGLVWLGRLAELEQILASGRVDRVIVTFTRHSDEALTAIIRSCDAHRVEVDAVPRLFDLMSSQPRTYDVGELALVRLGGGRSGVVERSTKRAFDIVGSGLLLLFMSPVMLVCAIALLFDDGRPILFRQERLGRDARPFRILKFRTMVRDADAIGLARIAALHSGEMDISAAVAALKPKDDPRITRLGGFLRRSSLDELPQLWNVLVGDMSLVGPRPLRAFECEAMDEWQLRRQHMRPGITGLWQVTSRSDADWGERMRLDYRYVRHWSLASDLRILARTATAVLTKKGAV